MADPWRSRGPALSSDSRNEDFYGQFNALATEVRGGGALLEQMLAAEPVLWDKADEIKEVEQKCDHHTHQIIQRLHTTFVTPIDREGHPRAGEVAR
jgi:uncharacterized protein Yka (UPF0111/DUF47 family)